MIQKNFLGGVALAVAACLSAAGCDIQQKTWEYFAEDGGFTSVQQTGDGGYIAGGTRDTDFWVVKLNSSGTVKWENTYSRGETGEQESLYSLCQTSDGGYIAAGTFQVEPGGDSFKSDIWIVKISSTGVQQWDFLYNIGDADLTNAIKQTLDGGYVVAGGTRWEEEAVLSSWIVKISPSGEMEWEQLYNDSGIAYSIVETADGGLVAAGGALNQATGNVEYFIRKTDSSGGSLWDKRYGRSEYDFAKSISLTSDGGFIVAGDTNHPRFDDVDCWILKLNGSGVMEWSFLYDGAGSQHAQAIQQTNEGGYIMAGGTAPDPSDPSASDYLIVKLDASGNNTWARTFHYDDAVYESANAVQQTKDKGFIMAGGPVILKLDSTGQL